MRVSVVMPAHNAQDTILDAVHSVLNQNMGELELIVCDDASTDATEAILDSINDPRLKTIRNDKNIGPGLSRDQAIDLATSPWIAVIDADDTWQSNRLERLINSAEQHPNALVFDDLMICHDSNGILIPWRPLHGYDAFGTQGKTARDIRLEDYITSARLLIKPIFPAHIAKRFGVVHSNRSFGEDAEYFIRLAAAGAKFRYLPEPLYLYRVKTGSATAITKDMSLMRHCIEACAQSENWPDNVQQAFRKKISVLRCNEALYDMAARMKKGDLVGAALQLVETPGLLKILPSRLLNYVHYQAHRIYHGGSGR